MLKRLQSLLKKDAYLVLRNHFLTITIIVAILFIVLINFVIPDQVIMDPKAYVLDKLQTEESTALVEDILSNRRNTFLVTSERELNEKLDENINSLGIKVQERTNKISVEYVLQGFEGQRLKNILAVEMKDFLSDTSVKYKTEKISSIQSTQKIKFNESLLPMFVLSEPVLLGLFFIAVLMAYEKEQNTTSAYGVSPGKSLEFLLSKIIIMLTLGLISMGLVIGLTIGFSQINLLNLILIVTVGSIFGTSLGLLISSFFDTLSKSMLWIVIASLILSLPMVSYYVPSFSPMLFQYMPTYKMLFSLKEAIFPTGNMTVVKDSVIYSAVIGLLCLTASTFRYKVYFKKQG